MGRHSTSVRPDREFHLDLYLSHSSLTSTFLFALFQIEEAKLGAKNRQVVLDACDELLQTGVAAINAHKEELRRKSEVGETVSSLLFSSSRHSR